MFSHGSSPLPYSPSSAAAFHWFMLCHCETTNLPNSQKYSTGLLSPYVNKLNQRNTLWRTVVHHPGINLSLHGLRVWFPAVLAPRGFLISSGIKGRQTKHISLFPSFCLVYLFCWNQPTTTSACLKTLETFPAHSPVHVGVLVKNTFSTTSANSQSIQSRMMVGWSTEHHKLT